MDRVDLLAVFSLKNLFSSLSSCHSFSHRGRKNLKNLKNQPIRESPLFLQVILTTKTFTIQVKNRKCPY